MVQEAKKYCREVMSAVKQLREKRDMSINEIKLTLAIEDPTAREKRDYLGIEVPPLLLCRILRGSLFQHRQVVCASGIA